MRIATGTVIAGKVVLDEPIIADGTVVYVLMRETEDRSALSSEELAEVEAGITEADRGEMISGEEFFRQLLRHG
jgi:predicted transcriptional regulator